MDHIIHKKMYLIDKYRKEYILADFNEVEYIYNYFDILKKSNSSIYVINNKNDILQLNTKDIISFFIIEDSNLRIWLN